MKVHLFFEDEQLEKIPIWKKSYDYITKLYNDIELWNMERIEKEFSFSSSYNKIKKIDAAKFKVLYKYGGIYSDMGVYVKKDVIPYLKLDKFNIITLSEGPYYLEPAFMYSPKELPIIAYIIEKLKETVHIEDVLESTGGIFLDNLNLKDLHILKPPLFNPLQQTSKTVLIHTPTLTWKS